MELNQKDLAELKHLLPPSFFNVMTIIGLEKTFLLVQKFGGTCFRIGQNKRKAGQILHFCLAEQVGEEAATRIETALAGQRELYIPKCDQVLRELRNRQMRREFDELTTRSMYPMTGVMAANNLARAYHLSTRQVWTIVNAANDYSIPENGSLFAA